MGSRSLSRRVGAAGATVVLCAATMMCLQLAERVVSAGTVFQSRLFEPVTAHGCFRIMTADNGAAGCQGEDGEPVCSMRAYPRASTQLYDPVVRPR